MISKSNRPVLAASPSHWHDSAMRPVPDAAAAARRRAAPRLRRGLSTFQRPGGSLSARTRGRPGQGRGPGRATSVIASESSLIAKLDDHDSRPGTASGGAGPPNSIFKFKSWTQPRLNPVSCPSHAANMTAQRWRAAPHSLAIASVPVPPAACPRPDHRVRGTGMQCSSDRDGLPG